LSKKWALIIIIEGKLITISSISLQQNAIKFDLKCEDFMDEIEKHKIVPSKKYIRL